MNELRIRGKGTRESGAFLLSKPESVVVSEFVCFDDLDPNSLRGNIQFGHNGFAKLWNYLEINGLRVVADVHTHPGNWTGQSITDVNNPMISMSGHLALIVPKFAQRRFQLLKGVGIYEYLGAYNWATRNINCIKLFMF